MGESWYSNHIASEFRPGQKIRLFYNKAVLAMGVLQQSCAHRRWYCLVYMSKMPQHRLELKFTSSRAFQKTTIKNYESISCYSPLLAMELNVSEESTCI